MILYKYISAESLNVIFSNDYISIKFSPFNSFNDPFESYGASIQPYDNNSLIHLTMRHEINNKLACLCLSKNPLNVLMWSHYGDKHEGFVIGLDTETAGFDDDDDFIITAINGNMNYSEARDDKTIYITHDNIYDEDVSRRLLLNKSLHWAYEDEVRVIKRTDRLDNQNGHLIQIVEKTYALKELYVGMRNDNFKDVISENECLKRIVSSGDVKLYRCDFKKGTWDLDKYPVSYQWYASESPMDAAYESLKKVITAIDRNKINP